MALMSRMYPEGRTEAEKREMKNIIKGIRKGIRNNYPDVLV